jgi:outer membrane receptor protein involved in Fe transport
LNFDTYRTLVPPIFLPPIATPFFLPTYEKDITCMQVQANLNYRLDEKISVSAMARYNHYDYYEELLYKPNFEANFTARYNMQDKIILKTQLYVEAGRQYAKDINFGFPPIYGYEKFDPIIDWSIGAEYRINKQWGACLDVNNILGQKYYQWYGYRSYGVNFLVGATFNL